MSMSPEASEETVSIGEAERQPRVHKTPHGDKLRELLTNAKLPSEDRPRVERQIAVYESWINAMIQLSSTGESKVEDLVRLLNEYKRSVELDLIWDSAGEFLYRQKGQLKLDNSILEEWFPWLIDPDIMPELQDTALSVGPAKAYAATHFQSVLFDESGRPGLAIRSKDQDFAIGRPAYLRASFTETFTPDSTDIKDTFIAYIAAELKTNLDKTMFQEASATSHDLTIAVPGSHYFLICEFLDMTPISSAGTDITEVLVLRGKRTGSQVRKSYSNPAFRQSNRAAYEAQLDASPVRLKVVQRFVERVRQILQNQVADLSNAVERGFF
ncbi:Bpu10I family restriction endonuclease [Microbacterium sp. Leaf436]|uniref:Bpu10I family restriction endonuclease n=1 Tax=Microbacterium sp. Leaf436 TaxID=1736377 RepID=UPI0006F9D6BE|nr:Bpu10I family restriction endonuclease [Microbacterium sp. Leaf436]KQT71997.1 hypothetical protein ASG45_13545 [Microbacterium sp. Leaf436]